MEDRLFLTWREFSRSRLHEFQVVLSFLHGERHLYTLEWDQGHEHNYEFNGSGSRFRHLRYAVKRWPELSEELPSIERDDQRDLYWMDDLYVCPICQRWHPHKLRGKAVQDARIFIQQEFQYSESDAEQAMSRFCGFSVLPPHVNAEWARARYAPRKQVAEYSLKMCGDVKCIAAVHREKDWLWHREQWFEDEAHSTK